MSKIKTYKTYKKTTNMTYPQLLKWSKNPISKTASIKPKNDSMDARYERIKLKVYLSPEVREESNKFNTAQIRNLVLLKTPVSNWDDFLQSQAKKSISYLSRAKTLKGKINNRALKNWGFDITK